MYVSSGTLEPVALRRSAATITLRPGGCELRVPYTGSLTSQSQTAVTCALRRLMIEMRYGTRLKGVTVTTEDQVLTVSAVASHFAIGKWVDSGEFIAAVDAAVRQARPAGLRL